MACRVKDNIVEDVLESLCEEGFDGIAGALVTLLNEVMKLERSRHLEAGLYERNENRRGYANGYKPKTLKSRMGDLNIQVPQIRDSEEDFYPSCIEKGIRSERALKAALAEMYIQGVSTRKIKAITEELCGFSISSTQVSRVTQELDEALEQWRNRLLGQIQYLILDARYESVRHGGHVIDNAVLIAYGIDQDGVRHVLGVSVSLSEAEVHWREFLESLVRRGLHGVEYIVSDAHAGLGAARKAVFPGVVWQRCQFHLQQNAQSYVPKKSMKQEVAEDIRAIFNAKDLKEAKRLLQLTIEKYEKGAPKLAAWMEENLPQGFSVFDLASRYRKKLRTSNMAEKINKEIKKRTKVVSIFPNNASCLRLVSAILIEIDEEWRHGRKFLNMIEN